MDYAFQVISRQTFDYEHGPRDVYGIFIVLEGRFSCTLNGKEYIVSKNEAWMFPKDVYFERKVLDGGVRFICLSFLTNTYGLSAGYLRTVDPVRFETTVAHLEQAILADDVSMVQHLLRDFFLMHRQLQNSAVRDDTVRDCISYLLQHHAEPIHLTDLAARYHLTRQGLIYKFKRSIDKTPMELLSSIRISQSKKLLRDSSMTVTDIAEACGFENVYYFSNTFKRSVGISPSDFRNLARV